MESKTTTEKILRGLELSYQRLVDFKKYKNSPLIIEENGVIKEIQPGKILPTTRYKRNIGKSSKPKS